MKIPFLVFSLLASVSLSNAATLKVTPQNPQPGDVLSVTIYPAVGETLSGIGMAAFDTPQVKFFSRADGSARAFVGFPFDRTAGKFPLRARVQTNRGEQILSSQIAARTRNYPTQRIVMRNRSTASKMNNTSGLRAERIYVQSRMKESYAAPLWNGSWLTPSRGSSSSGYGRKRYVNGKWWGQHNGSDIKAPSGAQVVASNSGRVVLSEHLPALRGNCVVIDHGCNVFSIYMHLSKRDVAVGQNVARGQQIGRVGATGFATGPHLHWEVRVGWEPVDPVKIVSQGLTF